MNKKSKKIKLGKILAVVYNDNYICIDGVLMIKKEYIEFEDTTLQSRVNNNEPFFYRKYKKTFSKFAPNLKQFMNRDWKDLEISEDTELILNGKVKLNVFYNSCNNTFTYINRIYYDIIKQCIPEFNLLKSEDEYAPLVITNKDLEPIGIVMPVINVNCFLHKLIKEQENISTILKCLQL